MPRRAEVSVRPIAPDAVYSSPLVTQVINKVMSRGKKSTAEQIVYDALDRIAEKTGKPAVEVLEQAVKTVTPVLEVKSRRVGPLERPRRLQRSRENLVEIDRARELPEDATATALFLRALEGARQLAPELVHPVVQARNHLGHPLVRPRVRAPSDDEQGQQKHHESAQAHADPGQKCRH